MNRLLRPLLTAALLFGAPACLLAAVSLSFQQNDTSDPPYNLQSRFGVPISSTTNVPPGSSGRWTNVVESDGRTILTPTNHQFQSMLSYGAVAGMTSNQWQLVRNNTTLSNGVTAFSGSLATNYLPVGRIGGTVVVVLRRGQIGTPYLSRQVDYSFGSWVQVPAVNENGVQLTNIAPSDYWQAEPFTSTGHSNSGYYWSPHAGKVYAVQDGPLKLTWIKNIPSNSLPADYAITTNIVSPGVTNYFTNYLLVGGSYYGLKQFSYVVAGSPAQTPRTFYWTEGDFRTLGKPLAVPAARINDVVVAYNNNFPRTVTEATRYVGPTETSPAEGSTNAVLHELRTLWFDKQQGQVYAYNREGRIFVEFLGDARPDGVTRVPLGVEIVDVIKSPSPMDLSGELGERLVEPEPGLTPDPILQAGGQTYAFSQSVGSSGLVNLFATRATVNLNDYLVHWMERGLVQGLRWPRILGRYQLDWPRETARYSHYVRPLVATDAEAKTTAVELPTANAPTLEFQDLDPAGQERGHLTENFRYYSYLDSGFPAHRALLRFTAGENVAFERVFSWLDVNLKNTNFANSVATNLTEVANFNYASGVAAYNTYQSNLDAFVSYTNYVNHLNIRSRGVNGTWSLYVRDDQAGGAGVISNWAMLVVTTNTGAGTLSTNSFTNSLITITDNANATPYPSGITVSGITNFVTAIQVRLNGLGHSSEADVDAFLVGPRSNGCALISDAGGSVAITNINLLFDDTAAGSVPQLTAVINGTYRPTDYGPADTLPPGIIGTNTTTLAALLLSAPPFVPAPPQPWVTSLPAAVPKPGTSPWLDQFAAPRVVNLPAIVGERLSAPDGEPGSASTNYLAGHLNPNAGTLYHPGAYKDPLVVGFSAASSSAIIPVNAVPGANRLEVWWFRTNTANAGANAANGALGFTPLYWPSVLGRYTLAFPSDPTNEIVLASNDGSGPLTSLRARGTIYVQNDRTLTGFNPNEEHALMQGGQAYALRDDLNLVTNGPGYSSEPFVLLDYTESDGRPAMLAFHVRREKGAIRFNYAVEAGTVLQPPMPLPLLEKPLVPQVTGSALRSLNLETYFRTVTASTTDGQLTTAEPHHFRPYFRELALQSPPTNNVRLTRWFFATNADYLGQKLTGVVSDTRAFGLANGTPQPPVTNLALLSTTVVTNFDFNPAVTNTNRIYRVTATGLFRFDNPGAAPVMGGQGVFALAPVLGASWGFAVWQTNPGPSLVVAQSFTNDMVATVNEVLTPDSPQVAATAAELLQQFPSESELALATLLFVPSPGSLAANQFQGWQLRTEPVPLSGNLAQGTFTLQDRKGNLWVYRGPHTNGDPSWMAMQFYYKTLPGFFFPDLPLAQQPPPGTITPYLRDTNANGSFAGNSVYGNAVNATNGDNNALAVHYRPLWPAFAPVLQMAETLTVPKRGLPAMRGQSSLQIVYQQSTVTNAGNLSVRLHDPTVPKVFKLGPPPGSGSGPLGRIPDSVLTETSLGKTYFPLLPPHLSQRFYLDPNLGANGALVFKGEFVAAGTGDSYLNLNVLSAKDQQTIKELCQIGDPARTRWENAVAGLTNVLATYVESPQRPGTYVAAEGAPIIGPNSLSEVTNSDVAVDSYALTAVGPGNGYVTLIAGNGRAFTPVADPVSVLVLRVSDALYPGELKVIQSPNPLAEKITFQQVVDLAGQTASYGFEWKIAAPVDGLPPRVYQTTPTNLLDETGGGGSQAWNEVRFPLSADLPSKIQTTPGQRVTPAFPYNFVLVNQVPFTSVTTNGGNLEFGMSAHQLTNDNRVTLRGAVLSNSALVVANFSGTVKAGTTAAKVVVDFGRTDIRPLDSQLSETLQTNVPQSVLFQEFAAPGNYSQLWLSLDTDTYLAANVYLNGELVAVANQGTNSTAPSSPPAGINSAGLPGSYLLSPALLDRGGSGGTNRVAVELFSSALPGTPQRFKLNLEAYEAVDKTSEGWLPLAATRYQDGIRAVLGESADVQALTDNYLIMRYRAKGPGFSPGSTNWSRWTTPQLAEGWIKRVLAGINPFNQRVTDLLNNAVNTDASLLISAGRRFEGAVALNLDSINSYGLIEIYETVMQRGRMLSIDSGINYGPANDALLLAAGYLNDLYMAVGNEAWADSSNPTIGIGTAGHTYSDIATALFAFKGQVPSLLEEELALLRGRDDFLQPGVSIAPVYNRLFWNYTRGIDAGEVIYALNYNIQENPNATPDGIINAADAARMFPQGHGDAYGHYLTALKGYYSLLLNQDFDWVPRIEAVSVLGVPVSVDYQDERKFAAAAAAVARTGRQIFDLTWRKDYTNGHESGWSAFSTTRVNSSRPLPTTRYWGLDHWATRTGQGEYLNWVIGNALLPAVDPDPTHEGIQKIDRTTVPELTELATMATDLQTALENAENGQTPLGIPPGSLALDINPNVVVGPDNGTHFEQIYGRAKVTLNNAVAAFDDAKDVTRLMRSEQDSLADLQNTIARQELSYKNALIELYGTPYTDDIGAGKTWKSGYSGPDTVHYMYVETPELAFPSLWNYPGSETADPVYNIDITDLPKDWGINIDYVNFNDVSPTTWSGLNVNVGYGDNTNYIVPYHLTPHGFNEKPPTWTGRRATPGKIQEAISQVISTRNQLRQKLYDQTATKATLDRNISVVKSAFDSYDQIRANKEKIFLAQQALEASQLAFELYEKWASRIKTDIVEGADGIAEGVPKTFIAGVASGGDLTSAARAAIKKAGYVFKETKEYGDIVKFTVQKALELAVKKSEDITEFYVNPALERDPVVDQAMQGIGTQFEQMQEQLWGINLKIRDYDSAQRNYRAVVAQGDRIQAEREVYRQRAAALVQGYRTRDAAFRIFRNEKLERYKTLFDLAARYSLLAANAYDYETGLLNTPAGRSFLNRIISARALGVVRNGEPQFAGSSTGDPGLSSALAEMKADWDTVKTRLGFNNPDAYGTTLSLRTEKFRILPTTNSDSTWQDLLQQNRKRDLLEDADVRRHCLQISRGNGLPVPGIIIEFSTTIANGYNFFGQELAAGDHAFSPSSFATKIFGVGASLEGYRGMDQPAANGTVSTNSPSDPNIWYLDPLALAATPYVYLIPVGVDSMRSPPLGDTSDIRSWTVDDVAIPLPFNIGASTLSSGGYYQSANSLSEPLFAVRKHQAFRPVPSSSFFSTSLYGGGGTLLRSQYTNNRLIGRSAWNSAWKLVVPGHTLLNDPDEGLERLIKTVRDIKLHFVTYSYSGN